jgi:DegT/DnrJ/EryC1/StrS aminotransferase family
MARAVIAPVPPPTLGVLAAVAYTRGGARARAAHAWGGEVDGTLFLSRGAWAFFALARWLEGVLHRPPRVWIPDYFCDPSLEPIRRTQARITFYPVDERLHPDWDWCTAAAREASPDLFVLVHYFGIPIALDAARDFARACGAMLLEDAAHVLRPASGIGTVGDFTLYCPHKVLGIAHGAMLVARENRHVQALAETLAAVGGAAPSAGPWLVRKILRRGIPDVLVRSLRSAGQRDFYGEFPSATLGPTPHMGSVAARMIAHAAPDLARAAVQRRAADTALRASCRTLEGWQPIVEQWDDAAPYRTVMRCDHEEIAAQRFGALARRGIAVEAWGSLPPEVKDNPRDHARAIALRRTLLQFPYDLRRPEAAAAAITRNLT